MSNVFVLCTGRCGSVTFIRSASHIKNYSAGHETRPHRVGDDRFAFPPLHIEADNRLSWVLGRLDRAFGKGARYVHLVRDPEAVARSFVKRWGEGIISAYQRGIMQGSAEEPLAVCRDYVHTVTSNIEAFLADKPHKMVFRLENANQDWRVFWDWIGAEGDLDRSLGEWEVSYNASAERPWLPRKVKRLVRRVQTHL